MKANTSEKARKKINSNLLILLLNTLVVIICFITLKMYVENLHQELNTLKKENSEIHAELYNTNLQFRDQISKNSYWLEQSAEMFSQNIPDINFPVSEVIPPPKKASEYIKNTNSEIEIRNLKYLDNIQQYSSEFIIQYVSSEKNETMNNIIMANIKALSDEICLNAESDTEKANRIAIWVCENICYNFDAAATSVTTDVISLETVISLKKATCAGYSNLFAALCQAQGIYCINLRGSASKSEDILKLPTNHEWNGVFCDGKWLFYDTTWASSNGYQDGKAYYGEVDKTDLEMNFEEMSLNHKIDSIDFRYFSLAVSDYY